MNNTIQFQSLAENQDDAEKNSSIRIFERIREKIVNEHYPNGTRIPAVRKAAEQFGVNPATVMKAYNRLEGDGLIEKRGGSGSYINYDPGSLVSLADDEFQRLELKEFNKNAVNFASGSLSADLFPVNQFKECLNDVLDRDGGDAFHYHTAQGYRPLRETVSNLLISEGLSIPSNNIQVVSGSQQAIDLIVRTLVREGDLIMMESPGYSGAINAFRKAGARIASLPVDTDGFSLKQVEETAKNSNIKLLYTTSTFQNPSGVTLSDYKKEKLIILAQKYDFLIVEDDCVSDLYYGESKPPLIKSFDTCERVIYIKSYSKIFMPGLRLGLIAIPSSLQQAFIAAKYSTDISNSGLNQRAFDLYLTKGYHREHSSVIRKKMSTRFIEMKKGISQMRNCTLCFEPAGGLYFWMKLNNGKESEILNHQNKINSEQPVIILPGRFMSPDRRTADYFRLSFAAVEISKIIPALMRLDRKAK